VFEPIFRKGVVQNGDRKYVQAQEKTLVVRKVFKILAIILLIIGTITL
jgi:hypothetical protein